MMNLTNAIPQPQSEVDLAIAAAKEEEILFIDEILLKKLGIIRAIAPASGIAFCCGARPQYGSFDKFMNYHFDRDSIKEIPNGKEGIVIQDMDGNVTIDWVDV